jgi:hypothetical protein
LPLRRVLRAAAPRSTTGLPTALLPWTSGGSQPASQPTNWLPASRRGEIARRDWRNGLPLVPPGSASPRCGRSKRRPRLVQGDTRTRREPQKPGNQDALEARLPANADATPVGEAKQDNEAPDARRLAGRPSPGARGDAGERRSRPHFLERESDPPGGTGLPPERALAPGSTLPAPRAGTETIPTHSKSRGSLLAPRHPRPQARLVQSGSCRLLALGAYQSKDRSARSSVRATIAMTAQSRTRCQDHGVRVGVFIRGPSVPTPRERKRASRDSSSIGAYPGQFRKRESGVSRRSA